MAASKKFEVEFSPTAEAHLRALTKGRQRMVLEAVREKLAFLPDVETRHRKRLRPNLLASWELRIGDLRVYYDLVEAQVVLVVAVGVKLRDRVFIGGEELKL